MGPDGLAIGHAGVAAAHLCLGDAGCLTGDWSLAQDPAAGMALRGLGRTEEAVHHFEQALDTGHGLGYRVVEGQALTALAEIMAGRGRFAEAARLAEEALESHRATGHRLGEIRTLAVPTRAA